MRLVGDEALLLLCSFSALISLIVAIQFAAVLRRISWRPPTSAEYSGKAKVSVIVPARNEEGDLSRALQSVLNQVDVEMEVFLVNDHSTDRTGAIADSLARADSRLTVVHDPELVPGWLGKANAMQHAAAMASGEYLIFTDADVVHDPRCFITALRVMEERGLDFFSLFPLMHCVSFVENAITPSLVGGLVQLATPGIEDSRSPDALAAGALLMVRSAVFRAVGGFEPIRDDMFDDVGLARLLKRRGYRVGFRAAPHLLQVRLFKGNRHAFWGMTKNILQGLGGRLWLAPAVVDLPVFVFWLPIYCLIVGVSERNWLLVAVAATAYALQYAGVWLGRSIIRFHPGKILLFPLVVVVVSSCLVRAFYFYTVQGAVQWRGRTIKVRTGLMPTAFNDTRETRSGDP
jgi:glycosyltransferase involved in cell wall biosynthesis